MKEKSKLALKLTAAACAMFGFSFLLVPLYDILCEVTGLNGKTGTVSEANLRQSRDASAARPGRPLTMEMMAHADPAMGWRFEPEHHELQIETGREYTIYYLAENNTERDMTVQAAPSVVPARAAAYLKKVECFCFEKQFLAAGEERRMPARVLVNSGLPPDLKRVTLNYTLFAVEDRSGRGTPQHARVQR